MSENYKSYKKFIWTAMENCTKDSLAEFENGEKISSPEFNVKFGHNNTKWRLEFFPNGERPEEVSKVGLFLKRLDGKSTFNIKFRFKIKKISGEYDVKEDFRYSSDDFRIRLGWGFPILISHEDILKSAEEFIEDGKLRIICEMTMTSPYPEDKTKITLSVPKGIQKMFGDEVFADFEIKCCDDEVFKCHKVILAAQSPVFFAMLSSGLSETQKGSVEIQEFDSEVMKQLLRFIYYHKIEDLKEIAGDLLVAADKYMIEDLKNICMQNIIENLTRDNVVEVLLISKKISNSDRLFSECVDIVMLEYLYIKETFGWKSLPKNILLKVMDEMKQYNSEVENV